MCVQCAMNGCRLNNIIMYMYSTYLYAEGVCLHGLFLQVAHKPVAVAWADEVGRSKQGRKDACKLKLVSAESVEPLDLYCGHHWAKKNNVS